MYSSYFDDLIDFIGSLKKTKYQTSHLTNTVDFFLIVFNMVP